MTLKEQKEYLSELISWDLEIFLPFVVVDPCNVSNIENIIKYPFITIDLATTKSGDIMDNIVKILSNQYSLILFKNIDKIRSRKDKNNWISLIVSGLKSERRSFIFNSTNDICGLRDFTVPFDRIKVVCTCSEYPDFLRQRDKLGWVGCDFSKFCDPKD